MINHIFVFLIIETINKKYENILFQPDVVQEWLEELLINEQLLMLKRGVSSKVAVFVDNVPNDSIIIPGNTLLGELELVSSVTPAAAKIKEAVAGGSGASGGGEGVTHGCSGGRGVSDKALSDVSSSGCACYN